MSILESSKSTFSSKKLSIAHFEIKITKIVINKNYAL